METNYEVIIIGGSYSGLSAAMALGRALRKTLVIDSGKPCNRFTPHSYNFITHDGEAPAAIAAIAKEQVMAYPTVHFVEDTAVEGAKTALGFSIATAGGKVFSTTKLLFATGVTDIMPEIAGFEDRWGKTVIHCPYCHGYEVKNEKTAILANGEAAYHYVKLLRQWTDNLTIFTDGPATFDAVQAAKIAAHNIEIVEDKVVSLKNSNGRMEQIITGKGIAYDFKVVYSRPSFRQHCDIPRQLGCAINEHGFISTDEMQTTSVDGVYASGDCTTGQRAVAIAVAGGMKAGTAINYELAAEVF